MWLTIFLRFSSNNLIENSMPNCNNCGNYITVNAVYKRQIYVGRSSRTSYGKRTSFSSANHYRKRSVCKSCALKIDKINRRNNIIRTIFYLMFLGGIIYYFIK